MDFESAKLLLGLLVENSNRLLRAGFGVNAAEATFFDVVRLLRDQVELKSHFLEMTRKTLELRDFGSLDEGRLSRELIELVAHELRWPEIGEIARDRIALLFHGDQKLAVGDIATSIAGAYEGTWQDRDFYEHYRTS